MHVLLLRPVPANDRFGLGPFFRIEPLGMEYIAAALEAQGHRATVADLRYSKSLDALLRATRPALVGIACMHALETDEVLTLAAAVRSVQSRFVRPRRRPFGGRLPCTVLHRECRCRVCRRRRAGGAGAGAGAGETAPPSEVPGLLLRGRDGAFKNTPQSDRTFALDEVPSPLRRDVDAWRRQYACLLFRPVWLIETARGCPFRCSFCSVWSLHDRAVRLRSVESVCADFEATGPHVFVADDLFWYPPARSLEIAQALKKRGIRKRWLLVQSRTDVVAAHPEVLEAWRPIAQDFDIFFGLEAATNEGLTGLVKDTTVDRTVDAIRIARALGYGVTGNFVIDPDWTESDFEQLWSFVEQHDLSRAGFTILTPLPGTAYFDEARPRLRAVNWSQYDMHHLLWEPRLGTERFFELYCETWRRSILNLGGHKSWRDWARQVKVRDLPFLTRMLIRTQRMMRPDAYIQEHRLAEPNELIQLGGTSAPLAG